MLNLAQPPPPVGCTDQVAIGFLNLQLQIMFFPILHAVVCPRLLNLLVETGTLLASNLERPCRGFC